MIGVAPEVGSYRVAVAELPASASLAAGPAGAVVVVSGGGRWDHRVRVAVAAGAAAVVVSRPAVLDAELIDRLAAEAGSVPVVLERPFLRHDAIAAVRDSSSRDGAAPAVIAVDVAATASAFDEVLRDAVGWMRVLSGGPPVLAAAAEGSALFEAAQPAGVPSVLTAVHVPAGADRIRADALGEERREIDASATGAAVSTTTILGRTTVPRRHESHERLTLRLAIAAAAKGEATTDLTDLADDAAIAAELARRFGGHKHH